MRQSKPILQTCSLSCSSIKPCICAGSIPISHPTASRPDTCLRSPRKTALQPKTHLQGTDAGTGALNQVSPSKYGQCVRMQRWSPSAPVIHEAFARLDPLPTTGVQNRLPTMPVIPWKDCKAAALFDLLAMFCSAVLFCHTWHWPGCLYDCIFPRQYFSTNVNILLSMMDSRQGSKLAAE